jgi:uncharacterized lipoprotein YmbA
MRECSERAGVGREACVGAAGEHPHVSAAGEQPHVGAAGEHPHVSAAGEHPHVGAAGEHPCLSAGPESGGAGRARIAISAAVRASCAALCSLLILSACASSAPLRYYTLSEVPSATEASSTATAAPAIRVGRVRIPGELDRTELVQRIDATRLRIAEQDRWAAPLDEMIRRALSADLQARGPTTSPTAAASGPSASEVTSATSPATSGSPLTLSLDIEEFIGDATCAVTLRAAWELRAAGTAAPVRTGNESIRVPPSSGNCTVGALPMAMSQALGQLSDRILAAGH